MLRGASFKIIIIFTLASKHLAIFTPAVRRLSVSNNNTPPPLCPLQMRVSDKRVVDQVQQRPQQPLESILESTHCVSVLRY